VKVEALQVLSSVVSISTAFVNITSALGVSQARGERLTTDKGIYF
jgi:hypothetical protein